MASCTLEIGGRIVARSEGGPFEAEYALFEPHEIDLASNNEPGTVREHGYTTIVELARERLTGLGATTKIAEAAAGEMGALASAYARGPEVRRVVTALGPGELFAASAFDAKAKAYDGTWLDVTGLAADAGLDGAARALQVIYLATLLQEAPASAPVVMRTFDWMKDRRAGERSHRWPALNAVSALPDAIRELGERGARPSRAPGVGAERAPTRGELLDWVRARLASCVVPEARTRLEALERKLAARDRPARGPLADAELWAIETQLGEGNVTGVMEKLDAVERSRGRQPGTLYLRARAQLATGQEDPKALAERVSALAMSLNAFAELELLAAEAWDRAGDRKRALAYARNLAEGAYADGHVRTRAKQIVEGTAAPVPVPVPPPAPGHLTAPATPAARASTAAPAPRPASVAAPALAASLPPAPDAPPIQPTPIVTVAPPPKTSTKPSRAPEGERPATASGLVAASRAAQQAIDEPPSTDFGHPSARVPAPPASSTRLSQRPSASERTADRVSAHAMAAVRPSVRAAALAESAPAARPADAPMIKGGSKPPFRTEPPPPGTIDAEGHVVIPGAPPVPRAAEGERVELAEALPFPPGAPESAPMTLPPAPPIGGTAMDARVYCTLAARELGRGCRQRFGAELRTDVRSLEILQRNLAERFPDGVLHTDEDRAELLRHGAFVAEVLARRLGAEWIDVAPTELGYWAMKVAGTRVWPIGRVARYVSMQHRERDLVSYFLELQARAHGLR